MVGGAGRVLLAGGSATIEGFSRRTLRWVLEAWAHLWPAAWEPLASRRAAAWTGDRDSEEAKITAPMKDLSLKEGEKITVASPCVGRASLEQQGRGHLGSGVVAMESFCATAPAA